jgi:hypothetical protein
MVDPVALPTKDVRNQNNSANPMTQTPSQVSSYPTAWDQAMPPHGFAPKRQKQFFFINSREIIPLRIYLKNGSVYFFQSFSFGFMNRMWQIHHQHANQARQSKCHRSGVIAWPKD